MAVGQKSKQRSELRDVRQDHRDESAVRKGGIGKKAQGGSIGLQAAEAGQVGMSWQAVGDDSEAQ